MCIVNIYININNLRSTYVPTRNKINNEKKRCFDKNLIEHMLNNKRRFLMDFYTVCVFERKNNTQENANYT